MKLGDIVRRAGQLTAANSPAILTGIGVAGTLLTAYLTHKAAMKTARVLGEESPHLTAREKIDLTWKHYIPPVGTAALTVTAIVCGHRIGSRRAAAVAAAYTISARAWEEFEAKVEEKIDPKKVRLVREEIAQDRINRAPLQEITILADGDSLVWDDYSKRDFKSTWEGLRKAQNDINERVLTSDDYATLSDFYELIGLAPTKFSEEVGWDRDHPLKLGMETGLTKDNKPCLVINYTPIPVRERRSAFRPL